MRQLCIFGWILAFAAAPAVAAQGAPLRVVTYHFNLDQHGFMSSTSVGQYGDTALGGMTMTGGRSGTITVNVLAVTKDGGLVVEAHEQIDNGSRPLQPIKCAVYGYPAQVICDQNLVQDGDLPEETDTLLLYFGQHFYDTTRLDDQNHWQTVQPLNGGKASLTNDYTVTGAQGNVLTIAVNRVLRVGSGTTTTTGNVVYDSGMTVPQSAHLVTNSNTGGELGGSILDFKMLSDSFAQKKP